MSLKRPSEIIEANPGMKKYGWNYYTLGYLFTFRLVRGKKLSRGCLLNEADVLRVFRLVYDKADIVD